MVGLGNAGLITTTARRHQANWPRAMMRLWAGPDVLVGGCLSGPTAAPVAVCVVLSLDRGPGSSPLELGDV